MIAATPEGVKQIEEKRRVSGKTAQEIADLAGVSRSLAQQFFKGQTIAVPNFQSLCKQLDLDWEEMAGVKQTISAQSPQFPKVPPLLI